jgi:SpoVK/Ycf46/Vps4 family AAA+-type ATPase
MNFKYSFMLFFFFLRLEPVTYSIDEITTKIKAGERTTIEEMQFYSFFLMANQGKTHVFANLFWIFFHMGNLAINHGQAFIKPHIKIFFTKRDFRKKIKIIREEQYSFNTIIGYKKQKEAAQKIVDTIKQQKQTKKYKQNNGILLWGPSGCGKTNLVKTIAKEAGVPLISVSITDLINEQGIIGKNIEILFDVIEKQIKEEGPCIIFFDEFDFFVGNRNEKLDQGAKIAIQNFLEKLESPLLKGAFIIACTNHKEAIDIALLRPGRLGNHIEINLPTKEDIELFYEAFQAKIESNNKNKDEIIDELLGLSAAEILNKINELIEEIENK